MYAATVTKLFVLSVLATLANCNDGEYFWRPWTAGSPPSDAVTVLDYRGATYIVEAYVPNYGLFIGQVFANQYEVNVTVANSTAATTTATFKIKSSNALKVLCTQSLEKLAWYPTNYKTLENELVTAVIKPVLGGINVLDQIAYIGRYVDTTLRTTVVGSIIKDDYLHYHNAGKSYNQANYEILVIANKCTAY